MSGYPASTDYFKAVQFPAQAFTLDSLRRAAFVSDRLGLPTLAMGTSAVVFHAEVNEAPSALRCFIRSDASSREHYAALGEFLRTHDLNPYVTATTWFDAAIQVNDASWPVLQMDWIEGRTLDEHISALVADSDDVGLATLAARWREMIADLQRAEFAHGDLQHGNVLVDKNGNLRLVDFDGAWIPARAGERAPNESGHDNYQHPRYNGAAAWGRWLDTFSALVIYLSLVALSKDRGLWEFNNADNLLFQKADYQSPGQTPIWQRLDAIGDDDVTQLAGRLAACCDPSWMASKSLEATIELSWWEQSAPMPASSRMAIPAVGTTAQPVPSFWSRVPAQPPQSGQPWWEQASQTPQAPRTSTPAPRGRLAAALVVTIAFALTVLGLGLIVVTRGISAILITAGLTYGIWGLRRTGRSSSKKP